MMLRTLLIIFFVFINNIFQETVKDFFTIEINSVCKILIPLDMEIQGVNYKNIKDEILKDSFPCYKIIPQRVIFQPEGINDMTVKGSENYARIIFSPEASIKIDFTLNGIRNFDTEIKNIINSSCEPKIQILKWFGSEKIILDNVKMIKTRYIRKGIGKSSVYVEFNYFIWKQNGYSITYSHNLDNSNLWEKKFEKSIQSIQFIK